VHAAIDEKHAAMLCKNAVLSAKVNDLNSKMMHKKLNSMQSWKC